MAVRAALATGLLSVADARAVETYASPVPLCASGTRAAEHGLADLDAPSLEAVRAIAKVDRRRAAMTVQDEATGGKTPRHGAIPTISTLPPGSGRPATRGGRLRGS
ncbi:hypothetical protein [Nonomuraea sp. NPDC049709]|uniref:hypothetical protein n=1 Tax=Nonomuraea sp. NPDC049709 TaxID=3154736 RepID=UPI00344224F8